MLRRSFFASISSLLPLGAITASKNKPRYFGWCDCDQCATRFDSEETLSAYLEHRLRVLVDGVDVTNRAFRFVNEADGFVDCVVFDKEKCFVNARQATGWQSDPDFSIDGFKLVQRVRGKVELRIESK